MRKLAQNFVFGSVLTVTVVAGLVGGSAVAGTVPALSAPAGVTGTGAEAAQAPTYPENGEGETYGSARAAISSATEPDLILVTATNGKDGYVYKTDLDVANGSFVTNPEEALTWQSNYAGKTNSVVVWDVEGANVVGEFHVVVPTMEEILSRN